MINVLISGLLKEAETVSKINKKPEHVKMQAMIITPEYTIKSLGVDGFSEFSDFFSGSCEDLGITIRLQPSVYIDKIIPFRDDLKIQLMISSGAEYVVREYIAVPLVDGDYRVEGNSSKVSDIDGVSYLTMKSYEFQLIDQGFAKIKDMECSHISYMSNMAKIIPRVLDMYSNQITEDGILQYDGTIMKTYPDNDINYESIVIPEGVRVKDLPRFLQESDLYGVYTRGLGSFYKQKRWWVYPLFDCNLYDDHPRPLNIIRIPEDRAPEVQFSFFVNDQGMTIISTGQNNHQDGTDIEKQNVGVGNRLILSDSVSGETGNYYNNGRTITTRADSLAEFQTSERRSGNDYIPLNSTPTSNVYKYASLNAANEGEIINVNWNNSDTGLLEPGHPLMYQYVGENNNMVTRKGILLGFRTDYKVMDGMTLLMKRVTTLFIFIKKQEIYNKEV